MQSDIPKTEERAIEDMSFTVADPLTKTKIYIRIKDLSELAVTANSPYSQQQLIDVALGVIKKTNDYVKGLSDWFALPAGQTWLNFKTHFQTAKRNLRKVRGATMRDTSFHAANKLSEDLQDVKDKMNTFKEVQKTVLGAIDENCNVMTQVANHIQNNVSIIYSEPVAKATTQSEAEYKLEIAALCKQL